MFMTFVHTEIDMSVPSGS